MDAKEKLEELEYHCGFIDNFGEDLLFGLRKSLIDKWKSRPSGLEDCCLANFWERICADVHENRLNDDSPEHPLTEKLAGKLGGGSFDSAIEPNDVELAIYNDVKAVVNSLSTAERAILDFYTRDRKDSIEHILLNDIDDEAFSDLMSPGKSLEDYINGRDLLPILAECGDNGESAAVFLRRLLERKEIWEDEYYRDLVVEVYKGEA